MSVLIWNGSHFVPPHEIVRPAPKRGSFPTPAVAGDIKPYMSPLGTGEITSRSHRREDLKRGNCRELDPSERSKHGDNGYINDKYAARYGPKSRRRRA